MTDPTPQQTLAELPPTLPHQEIEPIPGTKPRAQPSLWNTRYQQITENFLYLFQLAGKAIQYTTKTGAAILPKGPTEDRGDPDKGHLRFNETTGRFEGGNGVAWGSLGGATGGGNDAVFYENEQVITANFTVAQNAVSAGKMRIAPGVKVTIAPGGKWVLV